jgi:uncharacterized protein (TIGR00369 family)
MGNLDLESLNNFCQNTLIDHLGIEFTRYEDNHLEASMPVDHRTIQPMKIIHGGALMALAETVGSAGSILLVDREKYDVVGIEINGNHVGNTMQGKVSAIGKILHQGNSTHIWEIKIYDNLGKLISICRLTNMIIEKQQK